MKSCGSLTLRWVLPQVSGKNMILIYPNHCAMKGAGEGPKKKTHGPQTQLGWPWWFSLLLGKTNWYQLDTAGFLRFSQEESHGTQLMSNIWCITPRLLRLLNRNKKYGNPAHSVPKSGHKMSCQNSQYFFFRLLPLCLECEKYPDRFQTFSACHMSHGFSVFSSRFGWHRRVSTKISVNIPQCGAPKIAKLVNITPITMVYGTQITIVTGAYKPTYIWEASHCIIFHASIFHKYSNLIPLYHTTISWIFHSGFFVSASHLMRCWLYWKLYNIYIYITYNYTYCHEYHIIYPLFFPL